MKVGDKVTVTRENGYHISGWMWNEVNGKVGTIIVEDNEDYDWIVYFVGTSRHNGLFAFFEENLEVKEDA